MSKTTAYRMVRTLEVKDFLEHDAKTERYHLGKAGLPGAYLLMSSVGFLRSAHPFLEELARATGETVELTVGSAEGAVVVDEVATAHPFRLNRPTGRILSNLANSSFRMHVANRPLAEQRKIIAAPQHQWTPAVAVTNRWNCCGGWPRRRAKDSPSIWRSWTWECARPPRPSSSATAR